MLRLPSTVFHIILFGSIVNAPAGTHTITMSAMGEIIVAPGFGVTRAVAGGDSEGAVASVTVGDGLVVAVFVALGVGEGR